MSLLELKAPAGLAGLPSFSLRKGLINNTSGVFTVTVYGFSGTDVEREAREKGYAFVSLGTHTHTWDGGAVTKQPACEAAGDRTYTCTGCGAERVETGVVPALSHEPEHRNEKAATCTEAGYTGDEVCRLCGKTLAAGEAIPAGHKLTHTAPKEATYEAEGNIEYWICAVCGRCFADGAGAHEIDRASTVLARLVRPAGDADRDNDADGMDAALLLRYLAGLTEDIDTAMADADGDGRVTPADAAAILRAAE